jgi:hypothetical protein
MPRKGSIRQRRDGTFEARLVVVGKRRSLYGNTRREAQEKLSEAKRRIDQGQSFGGRTQTVSQYLEGWLTDHVAISQRPKTIESYALNIKRLTPYLGHLRLDRLKAAHIQHANAQLLASGLTARSLERAHAVLRCALHQAVKVGLIASPPTVAAIPPRPTRCEPQSLTPDEIEALSIGIVRS